MYKRQTHATFEPAGAIELHIVKQQLKKYELGELSHIENILKGESKDRIYLSLIHIYGLRLWIRQR